MEIALPCNLLSLVCFIFYFTICICIFIGSTSCVKIWIIVLFLKFLLFWLLLTVWHNKKHSWRRLVNMVMIYYVKFRDSTTVVSNRRTKDDKEDAVQKYIALHTCSPSYIARRFVESMSFIVLHYYHILVVYVLSDA